MIIGKLLLVAILIAFMWWIRSIVDKGSVKGTWKRIEPYKCPECERVTMHTVVTGTHERDSSNDYKMCEICGHYESGLQDWN